MSSSFKLPESIVAERIRIGVILVISFIVSLAIVITSGRILDDINKSGQKETNTHIRNAHSWAAWTVGISSALAGLSFIAFILLIVFSV